MATLARRTRELDTPNERNHFTAVEVCRERMGAPLSFQWPFKRCIEKRNPAIASIATVFEMQCRLKGRAARCSMSTHLLSGCQCAASQVLWVYALSLARSFGQNTPHIELTLNKGKSTKIIKIGYFFPFNPLLTIVA